MTNTLMEILEQFDIAETNLAKLDALWAKAEPRLGKGKAKGPDDIYDDARLAFEDLLAALPTLNGWKPLLELPRLDFQLMFTPESVSRGLREYRRRLMRARRAAIRDHVTANIDAIDSLLQKIRAEIGSSPDANVKPLPFWTDLLAKVKDLKTLLGNDAPAVSTWHNFLRHLGFGDVVDFNDIEQREWPVLKVLIIRSLYGEDDPVPGSTVDLGNLARLRSEGPVSLALQWDHLDDDGFERLMFTLLATTDGYENPSRLMKTRASDGGRDIEAYRTSDDPIAGTIRQRVIIQCRHWLSKSIAGNDVTPVVGQMAQWRDPPVAVLVFATSGHFTREAVQLVEIHNGQQNMPRIELWNQDHLDLVLSRRIDLVKMFKLRP